MAAAALGAWLLTPAHSSLDRDLSVSVDRLKTLSALLMRSSANRIEVGKSYVLSLVADGTLDPLRNPDHLELLFSPNDSRRRPAAGAYAMVTGEALRSERFPNLTSFVGPVGRSTDRANEPRQSSLPPPLIAELCFEDFAVIAFFDGSVRVLSREELGISGDDPIRAGPDSLSPLLRLLSE